MIPVGKSLLSNLTACDIMIRALSCLSASLNEQSKLCLMNSFILCHYNFASLYSTSVVLKTLEKGKGTILVP